MAGKPGTGIGFLMLEEARLGLRGGMARVSRFVHPRLPYHVTHRMNR
jgi:hypothetical protein